MLSAPRLPFILIIRWSLGLFLQEDDQLLQTGEAATLTGVWVREGRQPDQSSVAAYLPQTKQIGNISRLIISHHWYHLFHCVDARGQGRCRLL